MCEVDGGRRRRRSLVYTLPPSKGSVHCKEEEEEEEEEEVPSPYASAVSSSFSYNLERSLPPFLGTYGGGVQGIAAAKKRCKESPLL